MSTLVTTAPLSPQVTVWPALVTITGTVVSLVLVSGEVTVTGIL